MPKQKTVIEQLIGKTNSASLKQQILSEELGSFHLPYEQMKKAVNCRGTYMRMPFDISIQ
jgi:hypothetical protein